MASFFDVFPKLQRKIAWLLLFSVLALCFVAWLISANRRNIEKTSFWLHHTYEVLEMIERINTSISELGSPSYPHDGNGHALYKADLARAHEELNRNLGNLQQLTNDNPEQQKNLRELTGYIREIMAPRDSIGARDPSFAGSFHAIKSILGNMMENERYLLTQRQLVGKIEDSKHTYILITGSILVFLFIVLILAQLNKDILLRKEAEKELLKSELKYRNLIENAGSVIYSTDIRGNITFASAKAAELTGYSLEQLQGRNFSTLVDPSCLGRVTRHYLDQVSAGIEETTLTFLTVTRNGEVKWVEQFAVLLQENGQYAGFQCMVKDVSERKLMQLELEKSEQKLKENQLWLQSILDNTTSLIYIKDLSGRYIMANRRFLEVLNVEEDKVLNRTDYDFSSRELADRYKSLDDEVIRTGRSMEIEEVVNTVKGERNLLLIKFPLLDGNNNVFGISGIATDITERVHYQQQLIAATKDAQEAKGMQELFLANMSHEIRTPMNGIQGMTNLLLDTELNAQQKEFAGIIKRSVNNLLVIINDVLDFSKIRAGKLAIEKIDFRLQDVLDNVHAIFTHRVKKKGLVLQLEMAPDIPGQLKGDPYRLNQVLINLIGNAIKFTEQGSVKVQVSVKRLTRDEAIFQFTIADTGIGIPGQSQPYIFESFSQAGLDISRRFGGTGLGLAICNQLLQLQGGSISVASVEGKGSTFSFEIPYGYSDRHTNDTPAAPNISDYSKLLTGMRFLVAEDNEVNQQLVDHVLKKAGAAVELVNNGEEAVQHLQKDAAFDCIIMDLQMPVMDGYAATQHIRSALRLQTPIIAMTATAMIGEQLRCIEVGMNDYMTKPFEFTELYKRVVALLEKRPSQKFPY